MMFDPSVEVKHINVKNAISRELFYRILDFQEQQVLSFSFKIKGVRFTDQSHVFKTLPAFLLF